MCIRDSGYSDPVDDPASELSTHSDSSAYRAAGHHRRHPVPADYTTTVWLRSDAGCDRAVGDYHAQRGDPAGSDRTGSAVSYTHLDVYKRQVILTAAILMLPTSCSSAPSQASSATRPVNRLPVSYTHLDVYKRQRLYHSLISFLNARISILFSTSL